MIELMNDQLVFTFPEIHPDARLSIEFQRTLRIPDDGKTYSLPPGLGRFPLQHVDDFAADVPSAWLQRGGAMLPMYQAEAMWLNFNSTSVPGHWRPYPFAIKIATGKQCAVSGNAWASGMNRSPQDYLVAPTQPWLDGFVVKKGTIRQFVAMPLGSGYTAEEQLTGNAEHGGLQIAVCPMKRRVFEQRFPKRAKTRSRVSRSLDCMMTLCDAEATAGMDMGLAPGGSMRQEIYDDPFDNADWEMNTNSRCFVHLCNSLVWSSVTGSNPPHPAPTAKQYTKAGLPWFDYYDEKASINTGSSKLDGMKSVAQLSGEKGDVVLPENQSVSPENLVVYRKGLGKHELREGAF
ncbi:MAG: hypothetical protein AAFX06_18145 [Planctomycetota bacterium]